MKNIVIRRKSLAISILKGIGIAGLVLIAVSNPFFGLQAVRAIKRNYQKKNWRSVYHSVRHLDKRGFVKILGETPDGQLKVQITKLGESIIKSCAIDGIKLDKAKPWDGRWRIVIFDVPVSKNQARRAFAEKLNQLGFVMIQKSVWICPFECDEQIYVLRKFYEIEKFVTILKSDDVEDDHAWRRKWNIAEYKKV